MIRRDSGEWTRDFPKLKSAIGFRRTSDAQDSLFHDYLQNQAVPIEPQLSSRTVLSFTLEASRHSWVAMLSARVAARAGLRNFQVSSRSAALGGLRTYAAAAQQDVRPPVALYGVDGTYANALVCFPLLPIFLREKTGERTRLGRAAALRRSLLCSLPIPLPETRECQQVLTGI